jgi:transposase InsO family protein
MPWLERDTVSLRHEFVSLAAQKGCSFAELCRRYRISRKTGYKWRQRAAQNLPLEDRSRRPKASPGRTNAEIEKCVVDLRIKRPAWGARKLRKVLERDGMELLPATSTITDILHRHNLIQVEQSVKHTAWQRFEKSEPNELWQMDFKGYFQTDKGRCNPLTVLDDHSRYSLGLRACADQTAQTVQQELIPMFRRYGLPHAILADNGAPWGCSGQAEYTELGVWLLRLGIRLIHGRPFHPQTQGKDERFHRTLQDELLAWERFVDLQHCQQRFDHFHHIYNWERPHEALSMEVPGRRYRASVHTYPETLPPLNYETGLCVRRVRKKGTIRFRGREEKVGKAFIGLDVALRPENEDGIVAVLFGRQVIRKIDLRKEPL